MGFDNPIVPWREMERRLSGRPATEPEPAKPEPAKPTLIEPKLTGPAAAEPKLTGPGAAEPKLTEPETREPRTSKPKATQSQTTKPPTAESPTADLKTVELKTPDPEIAEPIPLRRGRGHGHDRGPDGGDSPGWTRKRPAYEPSPHHPTMYRSRDVRVPYAELHAHSSYSFLDGASDPEQLVEEAVKLGLEALAVTDHDGMYGIARFAEAAKAHQLPTVFGAELNLDIPLPSTRTERSIGARIGVEDPPGSHLLVLARNPAGYASLCRAISLAQLRGGAKGRPVYDIDELTELAGGDWLILTGCRKGSVQQALGQAGFGTFALDPARRALDELVTRFGRANVVVELTHALEPLADERYAALAELADEQRLELICSTNAHYATPRDRQLATAVAAIRARTSMDALDGWLPAWAGQHLRSGAEQAARFRRYPDAVSAAARLGKELAFEIALIAPNLPPFPVPAGYDEMSFLRKLAYDGAYERYGPPGSVGRNAEEGELIAKAYLQIEHELRIIEDLNYPGYFLVVWDLTQFCAREGILCQGRGSAANSAVCYALRVTAVDSVRYDLLFERFLAPERDGPPDIDIDIESDRREEVIQYVYSKHGRQHAAQVANVITYRPRSAVRDIARAFGYAQGQQDAWSKQIDQGYYWSAELKTLEESIESGGQDAIPAPVLQLAGQLQYAPRHLGIHSGGMVMCDRPVIEVCPVEWGRMPGRTVLQWDKDDCVTGGLVKFDLLGLGMLSALRYCFDFVTEYHGESYGLHELPQEDPKVYEMLCAADSIGVFQVESRAQMATLPRLRPENFYHLAIEIALIRPGPIQGNAVHPYIRRKNDGEEPVPPHPKLENALKRTLGIPLFQEQLMQVAIDGANFTASEADQLRRAMGSRRGADKMEKMRERLYDGMRVNGIVGTIADDIFERIKSFASFGFAESHAISFAYLVYASSWLKLYFPAAFCAALLNAQPMGFYSPQSLVQDAKRHGVTVLGPDLNASAAAACLEHTEQSRAALAHLATLEQADAPAQTDDRLRAQPAVRLGLAGVRTIRAEQAQQIVAERQANGPYPSMAELARRVGLAADQLEALATAGAFDCLGTERRSALWAAGAAANTRPGQLDLPSPSEQQIPPLPRLSEPEQLMADLWATGITRDRYPTALMRDRLNSLGVTSSAQLRQLPDRTRVSVAGIVTHRQRPATARGITFVNLEDEFGMINVICDPVVWQRHRLVARQSGGLLIRGMLERAGGVLNVSAERIDRLELGIGNKSRDFR